MLLTFLQTRKICEDGFITITCNKDETYDINDSVARSVINRGWAFEPRSRADGFKANHYLTKTWLEKYKDNTEGFLHAFEFIQASDISNEAKDEITELYLKALLNPIAMEERKV